VNLYKQKFVAKEKQPHRLWIQPEMQLGA